MCFALVTAVLMAWLVLLVGIWVADWDISPLPLPLPLAGLALGAFRRSRWFRGSRGRPDVVTAGEAVKGYPNWW
ncbi:hypothetical protein Daura_21710 [Dactylosporangium aurantiacum]|uniref:Uncharacterized protein n=1 Tax=Dactylosporangium aurantiacum TaxID=35754 RepID=A0A9Q9MRJ6_9ACTN|nr:hypothetical protein [Dactylosporangium aurantiacum]MDG6110324.1 hypothetical protein [Dactylosporangium aurantiacum]UWZ58557.1 hypothetical protein Daura_21710 [Dactylosporangium aurantiacum]